MTSLVDTLSPLPPFQLSPESNRKSEEDLASPNLIYKSQFSNSTSQLPVARDRMVSPVPVQASTYSRPRSVSELRKSALFYDSEGSAESRLSIIFADPKDLKSGRNSVDYKSLPRNLTCRSYTLTENDSMMDVYRQNARKTNDPKVQLEFAKFLLESSRNLSNPNSPTYDPEACSKLEKEGIFWIRRLQKLNHPEATHIVGTWHENGLYGTSPSESRANSLFVSAAKLGHPAAVDKVASHYERKKDYTRAVAYYKKAASLADPSSNYRLGIAYTYGELKLHANFKNAQFYLRRGASLANKYCPQGAYVWALILFGIYEKDLGIRDEVEGREYLIKSGELNYAPAQFKLGFCYEFGEFNFPVDPRLSIEYYQLAADRGHPDAQVSLSGWYLTGCPGILEQNDEYAFQWCNKACSQGLGKAEYAMGQYCEMGVGTPCDIDAARSWYQLAAKHGFEKASERLNEPDLAPALSRAQFGSMRQQGRSSKDKKKGDCTIS